MKNVKFVELNGKTLGDFFNIQMLMFMLQYVLQK